jgi:hypothetical protein
MEDNKYTALDKLFKNRVEDGAEVKADWNTPSKSVFENALNIIDNKRKKKRKVFFFWIFGISAVLSMVALFSWGNLKLKKIDQKIDDIIHNQVINVPEKEMDKTLSNGFSINEENNQSENIGKDNVPPIVEKNEKSINVIASKQTTKVKQTSVGIEEVTLSSQAQVASDNSAIVKDELLKNDAMLTTSVRLAVLNLDRMPINANELVAGQDFEVPFFLIPEEKNPVTKLQFAIQGGLNLSSFSMSSPNGLSTQLTKYDQWYPGFQLGLSIDQNIHNRWNINYSLSYQNIRNKSHFSSSMAYDENKAQIDGLGDLFYYPDLGLDSPMGLFMRSLKIKMGDEPIENDDILNGDTDITNEIQMISLKLGPQYNIVQKKDWELSANAGIGINYMLGLKQNMDTKIYYKSKMLIEDSFASNSMAHTNALFLTGYLGIGFKYKITDHLYLGSNLIFENALQSIRKVDASENIKTHLSNFGSTVSIGYTF